GGVRESISVRDVAGDVQVRSPDIERVGRELIAVRIRAFRLLRHSVVSEEDGADANGRRVVRRRIAGSRGDLCRAGKSERCADRGQAREPPGTNCQMRPPEMLSCPGSVWGLGYGWV